MRRGVNMKTIEEVMTTNLITVDAETNLQELLKIMKEKKVGKLPVIKESEVIGVVTRDDLLLKKETAPLPPILALNDLLITLPSNKKFKEKLDKITAYKAEKLMRKDILKVNKEEALDKVITEILEEKYEFALVLEGKKLIGIITKTNLIESF
jgi:CBS domain-containing protein